MGNESVGLTFLQIFLPQSLHFVFFMGNTLLPSISNFRYWTDNFGQKQLQHPLYLTSHSGNLFAQLPSEEAKFKSVTAS